MNKETRFYVVTTEGRFRIHMEREADVITKVRTSDFYAPRALRIVKETKETIWTSTPS